MVERLEGFEAAFEHPVDEAVVEGDALGVDGHAVGHDARPGGGEAVGVHSGVVQEVEVFGPAVVVVAGEVAVFGADDVAGCGGEGVPMGGTCGAMPVAFDLVGGGRGTEKEAFGEVAAVHAVVLVSAGPVERPRVSSASQSSDW